MSRQKVLCIKMTMTDYGVANMKKIKWVISLLLFSQHHVFGDGLDTFPMADITLYV